MTGCLTKQWSHIAAHRLRSQQRLFCNEDVRLGRPVTFLVSRGSRWIPRAAWKDCLPYSSFLQLPTPFSFPLFFSSSKNIIHSHQLQHVSNLSSRGKCQWLSDGWKRSGVQMGSRLVCVCLCGHMCTCAGRWICGYFSSESHQREIITLANLILTK